MLRLVPVALAALVYYPIAANYFFADDFLHLYELVNEPLLQFVLEPFGGHLYAARNLVLAFLHALFGSEPRWYFCAILTTHLLNVSLLFEAIRLTTGSARLACAGASLWGTAPVLVGTLGWLSVYGHVLSATILLGLLVHLLRVVAAGSRISFGTLAVWYALLLAGATTFGSGIAAALAFPLAALLLLPPGSERRRVVGILATLWIAVPALYVLDHWAWVQLYGGDARRLPFLVTQLGSVRAPAAMLAGLLAYGVASLHLGFLWPAPVVHGSMPWAAAGAAVACAWAAAVVAALVRGSALRRRQLLAALLLAAAAYAATAAGRANLTGLHGPGASAFTYGATLRYHYVGPMALALATCVAVAALCEGRSVPAWLANAALAAVLGLIVAAYVGAPRPIDHWPDERQRTTAVVEAIRAAVRRQPPGADVLIPNRGFPVKGLPIPPGAFPGWAGVFAVFFPDDVVEGRRVRFVSSDPAVLAATRTGRRTAVLLVPAPAP